MDIHKIYVTVDKKDYPGLYWITRENKHYTLFVSYEGVKQDSQTIKKADVDNAGHLAKTMLPNLITNLR